MAALKHPKEELFARAIAEGLSQTKAAIKAGYSPKSAASQGCILAKRPHVAIRAAEIRSKAVELAALPEHQAAAALVVSRAWMIEQLYQNLQDARADKQYATVKATIIEMGKVAGVYVERSEHDHQIAWAQAIENGDLASLDDQALERFQFALEAMVFGKDQARIEANRRRVEKEAGIVDVQPVQLEAGDPLAEEKPGWEPPKEGW